MNLNDYKIIFASVFLVLVLVGASPTLSMVISLPAGERFSELWLLGPGHLTEGYPFNVTEGASYSVFLGVANHMRGLEYYAIYVKLRNQTESFPNATLGIPSQLAPLYEYPAFLSDGETWEKNVTFSFSGVVFESNSCRVSYLSIDGFRFFVNKTVSWDAVNKGYYFELFFELWLYNAPQSQFVYHDRFVGLWLNMTAA